MFQLVLYVCIANGPCHNEYLTSTAPNYRACMADEVSMAKFIGDHPEYTIVKWHCNGDGKQEADL